MMGIAGTRRPWPGGRSHPGAAKDRPGARASRAVHGGARPLKACGSRLPQNQPPGTKDLSFLPPFLKTFSLSLCKRMDGMPACAAFTNSHFTTMCGHFKNCVIFKKWFFDFKSGPEEREERGCGRKRCTKKHGYMQKNAVWIDEKQDKLQCFLNFLTKASCFERQYKNYIFIYCFL